MIAFLQGSTESRNVRTKEPYTVYNHRRTYSTCCCMLNIMIGECASFSAIQSSTEI